MTRQSLRLMLVAIPLIATSLSPVRGAEVEAANLLVLDEQVDGSPDRWLYDHLAEQAYAALDQRRADYESVKTAADVAAYQERRRKFFLEQLGGFPERQPLNAQVVGGFEADGYRVEKLIFESRPHHHVTAVMYLPVTPPPYPCVVVSSGHSRTAKAADYNQRFGIIMAQQGMAALCYDPIGQGERSQIRAEDGQPKHGGTTTEHFYVGVGSILLGKNTATYRVWDAIRAIDFVQSRPDIDAARVGFTGCSGGGTLTSYVMALDERVLCAAPACYLTTFRKLIETIGPQDAEQNIFGQIAFGMDHPDYVLMRAPRPTLISATTEDFFDITGTWDNFRQAQRFYTRLGHPERVAMVEGDGGHGVPMTNLVAIQQWMQRWLMDDRQSNPHYEGQFTEIPVHPIDALQCTPTGQVLDLPGELSVFELNAHDQRELAEARASFWNGTSRRDVLQKIRELAAIQSLTDLPRLSGDQRGETQHKGFRVRKLMLGPAEGVPLPALLFLPSQPKGEFYLYLGGQGKPADLRSAQSIVQRVEVGAVVLAVDLPGLGETRPDRSDGPFGAWKEYYLAYLLGKSLVGMRAEAALQSALFLREEVAPSLVGNAADLPVHLLATGEATIPALHAAAVSELFNKVTLPDGVPSWVDIVGQTETENQLVGTVHGALKYYELDDLARLHGTVD